MYWVKAAAVTTKFRQMKIRSSSMRVGAVAVDLIIVPLCVYATVSNCTTIILQNDTINLHTDSWMASKWNENQAKKHLHDLILSDLLFNTLHHFVKQRRREKWIF